MLACLIILCCLAFIAVSLLSSIFQQVKEAVRWEVRP